METVASPEDMFAQGWSYAPVGSFDFVKLFYLFHRSQTFHVFDPFLDQRLRAYVFSVEYRPFNRTGSPFGHFVRLPLEFSDSNAGDRLTRSCTFHRRAPRRQLCKF